jgi:hypothetical protein
MRHAHAQFSKPDTSNHIPYSADCITNTSESEFVVHTARPGRAPSPLLQNLIFGTDRCSGCLSRTAMPVNAETYQPQRVPGSGDSRPELGDFLGTIQFGLRGMGVAPEGSDVPNTGHHHLLIDTELPPLNEPIPSDFNHLHFGAGQTEAQVTLQPGRHILQLLLGDKNHVPHSPAVMSPRIRVVASDAKTASPAATSVKKRRHVQARSRNYHSSAAYRNYSRSRSP